MKKALLYFILCFGLFPSLGTYAQTWVSVGSPAFSAGEVNCTSIAIDTTGTPYVVYMDFPNSGATVMKYNGTSWVTVGTAGFSDSEVSFSSIAIDRSGTPYVVYTNGQSNYIYYNGMATVMKYNGSSWVTVGIAQFSAGTAAYTSIAIDTGGTPYVVYSDYANGLRATVMKYNGSSWVAVGSPGFSAGEADYTSIAIDKNGTPYVAYEDNVWGGGPATVMKYNGSSWVTVGSAGFSAGMAWYTSIAIDNSGTPYVVYMDGATSDLGPTVMKYYDSSWITVGSPGFGSPPYQVAWTSIAIDTGGTPYVVYSSPVSATFANAMKYNGSSWVNVGNPNFSAGYVEGTSIAIDKSGTPYVVYGYAAASVMKLDAELSPIVGTGTLCIDSAIKLNDTTTGGVWSSSDTAIATVSGSGIVTSISTGTAIISYTVSGNSAIFMVTVDSCFLGVQIINNHTQSLTIFPNPATTSITLQSGNTINQITITNLLGQTFYSGQFTVGSSQVVDVSGFAAGVYFVKVNGTEVRKFVKE